MPRRATLVPAAERRSSVPRTAVPGPEAAEVTPGWVALGDPALAGAGGQELVATFAVTGYPAEVTPGWWATLLTWPGRLDLAIHIDPIGTQAAADRLRRSRSRLEASRRHDAETGRLTDPRVDAAADDAAILAARVARGDGRLFSVGVYLTVRVAAAEDLAAAVAEVRGICAGMLLTVVPVTWRQLQGFTSSLPLGVDRLGIRRILDTDALVSTFPFGTPDLPLPAARQGAGGVFWGFNAHSPGPVVWDRWSQPNHNAVILAASGAGKSYLAKLDLLRNLYSGVSASVIDPDGEYGELAAATGGQLVALGAPGVHLNPLDLPDLYPDAIARRALFAVSLVEVLLGVALSPGQRGAWDQAVRMAYRVAGFVEDDPGSWRRPAPLLADAVAALAAIPGEDAAALAGQLDPYVTGSASGLFAGATTARVHPACPLAVYALSALPDELTGAGMLLTLDAVWRRLTDPRARGLRKLAVVDEAWQLLQNPAGARFLFRAAKASRKHRAGLTVISQDVDDVLSTELGRATVTNAATPILLRQAPQTIDALAAAFDLSPAEVGWLLAAQRGDALLAAGARRVAFRALADEREHALLLAGTTDQP
ncbi:VirB4 family type IV secretion system protein [Cryptosporangium sp. NPDC048952]|uniref:VirB4 family type IV secretion system protein n=1 Tax=Cryptosporangium sp. NPDC048952 TaxID=3363961 RepID=UPI00371D9922